MKSDGVNDMVKWLKERVKKQVLNVREVEASRRAGCTFTEGEYWESRVREETAILAEIVSIKRSTEKYMKKLRHEEREAGVTLS